MESGRKDDLVKGLKKFFGVGTTTRKYHSNYPRYSKPTAIPESKHIQEETDQLNIFWEEKTQKAPPIDTPTKPAIHEPAANKEFMKIFRSFSQKHRSWDIWRDFVTMFACSISNAVDKTHYEEREALYMDIIRQYSKEEQQLFPKLAAQMVLALEQNPEQDFLGGIFMELNLGSHSGGQYFTPYCVCQVMASITSNDLYEQVKENGYVTINDCACGAGATLIAGINEARKQLSEKSLNFQNHILVSGQDIDRIAAYMCYIQLSLLGVAGYIKVGNTLTDPMQTGDDLKNYWFTPLYFSDVWAVRRLFHNLGKEFEHG